MKFLKKELLSSFDEIDQLKARDNYYVEKAKKDFQITFTRCLIVCIGVMATGFCIIFIKYIHCLAWDDIIEPKTEQILSNILDWTMKIVIGWLAKSFFEKNKIN